MGASLPALQSVLKVISPGIIWPQMTSATNTVWLNNLESLLLKHYAMKM
jgi:hypothetical protein